MEAYGKILLFAMPVFLLLVLAEKWYGQIKGRETVRLFDMISSLTSGVTNVTKDVLGLAATILTYAWLVDHIAITHIKATWITYVVAFIALDFAGYLVHMLSHKINFFWNGHIIHHSSEDFNLACALRQSISVFVRLFVILLLPAALLGVPNEVIQIVAPLHLFAQFWYHTEHINKMGFLEKIIVTPSHHRVHHAINPEYIDRNYGQIFIIWDKLFGTYKEEIVTVPPVYGITRPVQTWNPIKINFKHLSLMISDAWHTPSIKNKWKVFAGPTGWRPSDVAMKKPVYKIENVYDFKKYTSPAHSFKTVTVFVQMLVLLVFVSYLFGNIALIGKPDIFLYGLFIFLFVYALTDVMDGSKLAWVWDLGKMVFGAGIIIATGDWFKVSTFLPGLQYGIFGYFILSAFCSIYINAKDTETAEAFAF